tara:strand:+ start:91 stop:294 length:204 start_codon:yes stop_codon:yes gene_type:complete
MPSLTMTKLTLSSKYLEFQEWLERYEEDLIIYWQESSCHLDSSMKFKKWAKGFYSECQIWDEYESRD